MGNGPSKEEREREFREYHHIESALDYDEFLEKCKKLSTQKHSRLGESQMLPLTNGSFGRQTAERCDRNREYLRDLRLEHIQRGGYTHWGGPDGSGFAPAPGRRHRLVEVDPPTIPQGSELNKFDDDEVTLCNQRL